MPGKWQQWFPFRIDAFRGSPSVQAMHPAARAGYLYLLSAQWQSDDGTIASDALSLSDASGLGDELWALHGPRILRKFDALEAGRLRNAPLHRDWLEAKRIYESRQSSAQHTNESRSTHGDRTVTARVPSRSAGTRTKTLTSTSTQAKASCAEASSAPAATWEGKPIALATNTGEAWDVLKADVERWTEAYPAVDVIRELLAMREWLDANPRNRKTRDGMRKFIVNWLSRSQNSARPEHPVQRTAAQDRHDRGIAKTNELLAKRGIQRPAEPCEIQPDGPPETVQWFIQRALAKRERGESLSEIESNLLRGVGDEAKTVATATGTNPPSVRPM